ncbi:MAG TPA: hypothetical protein VMQ11_15740 [Alphaproteobacteria bacterium]|nr:hypothetical protein [Alphaproteobacteria bacterium]
MPFDVDPDWYTRHWEKPAPRDGQRSNPITRTAWLVTAGLAAWFVAGSSVAGWLATAFGWFEPAMR